ncbi:putative deoxyribonuclease TATDN1 like protein [Dictyocoela muelleri]|nr:putative deoxyribonuclease TATDN1 like protein [Dictyocoela muelleri]
MFDIAVNITDKNFKDLDILIENSHNNDVKPIFISNNVKSSEITLKLAEKYDTFCYVGVHPLDANYDEDLSVIDFIRYHPRVIAIGECGLDYFRTTNVDKIKIQRDIFERQLKMKHQTYFLHCRNAHDDFISLIREYQVNGVVHSFTGTVDQMTECIEAGLFIGLNGCSLRDNVELARIVPLDKLLVGTDSPYCKIKKNNPHYDFVRTYFNDEKKHVNEPRHIHQIIEIISGLRKISKNNLINILNLILKSCLNETKGIYRSYKQIFRHWSLNFNIKY